MQMFLKFLLPLSSISDAVPGQSPPLPFSLSFLGIVNKPAAPCLSLPHSALCLGSVPTPAVVIPAAPSLLWAFLSWLEALPFLYPAVDPSIEALGTIR